MKGRTNVGGGSVYAVIDVTYPEGATCTCTNGTRTLKAKNTSGRFLFAIPKAGEWTVTAEESGVSKSEVVNVIESKAYIIELMFRTYYFKNGDVSELTGGWTKGATGDELSLRINVRSDGYSQSDATKTNNTIDFSKINTVHVVGSLTASGEYSNANFSVGSAKVSVNGGTNTSNTKKDFSVDVSNVSSGQITINLTSGRDYASCAITEIYGV